MKRRLDSPGPEPVCRKRKAAKHINGVNGLELDSPCSPPVSPRRKIVKQHNGTNGVNGTNGANGINGINGTEVDCDALVISSDPLHPANHICELCTKFYQFGWVTGTGGGLSIRHGKHIFIAPSGVQKELMKPADLFVMEYESKKYLRRPLNLKPSACTPLFLAAFEKRNSHCCIHTHSQWAVLVTLICESGAQYSSVRNVFAISEIEQIKGISRGGAGSEEIAEGGRKLGNLGFFDTLKIPIIENTAHEEDLRDTLGQAIVEWPETCAVLVRRHGLYVWGKNVAQAKTQCESLDYLFQLAVEMHRLGLKWVK